MKRLSLLTLCATLIAAQIFFATPFLKDSFASSLAGVFFRPSITNTELAQTYTDAKTPHAPRKVKILIVPGHDDASPGARYKNLIEKDLTLSLAEELQKTFAGDAQFEVTLARDSGGYNDKLIPTLLAKEEVLAFRTAHKQIMDTLLASGTISRASGVYHNDALPDTAVRLYAINKWANENDFDLIINIHFNDYPNHVYNTQGKYNGFAIYVPEKQFSNAIPSLDVANHIKESLNTLFVTSNHPQEKNGVVEDQELIAIGAYNTLEPAVVLVEYEYLYVPVFADLDSRTIVFKKYAQETYNGIKNYFEEISGNESGGRRYAVMTHDFTEQLEKSSKLSIENLYLQLALSRAGVYPPRAFDPHECTFSKKFGDCTEAAVKEFQIKYSIPPTGIVGEKTREALMPFSIAL